MAFEIKSSAFQNDGHIPVRYTGEGEDISPSLEWSNVPKDCREFALVCVDPDAPGEKPFVHWVAYNIDPTISFLPEGLPAEERLEIPAPVDQGLNSFGKIGYGGPLPPIGHGIHHYVFKLYALDAELGLTPGARIEDLEKAIEGHILDAAQLIGKYIRESRKNAA